MAATAWLACASASKPWAASGRCSRAGPGHDRAMPACGCRPIGVTPAYTMQVYPCGHCGHRGFLTACTACAAAARPLFRKAMASCARSNPHQGMPHGTMAGAQPPHPESGTLPPACTHRDDGGGCNFAPARPQPAPLARLPPDAICCPLWPTPLLRQHWARIEAAKRQLFYTLARLVCRARRTTPDAGISPRYALLADQPASPPSSPGTRGTITLNVAGSRRCGSAHAAAWPARTPPHAITGPPAPRIRPLHWGTAGAAGGRLDAFAFLFGARRAPDYAATALSGLPGGPTTRLAEQHVSAYARPPLGRLGRDLGALPAHGRPVGNRFRIRHRPQWRPAPMASCASKSPTRLPTPAPPFDTLVRHRCR